MILRLLLAAILAAGCSSDTRSTEPPPDGWANHAPTRVDAVIDRQAEQLLAVSQGEARTWVQVPAVGAKTGDYVLLGQGTVRRDVAIPETGERVTEIVDIAHVRVVDRETAHQAVRASSPAEAIAIAQIYAELEAHADTEVVVTGTVRKAPHAIGWYWVHLVDGTGDAATGTHDLTVKTQQSVTVGQRVAFRGTLRSEVDLGFGYHYTALVEEGLLLP